VDTQNIKATSAQGFGNPSGVTADKAQIADRILPNFLPTGADTQNLSAFSRYDSRGLDDFSTARKINFFRNEKFSAEFLR